ncbi:Protein of uncharacterised function (DUF3275) [Bordetella ansorpii]|uniref:Protein of uncharacterized function (DUF3275) n=1 Tax=Bordetella ansorpii TaxID=288768 RepID=A0A157SDW2_9BORD|nr:Protein of uncharacterised function (DUF3275) [Bordetella ansorpii]
MTATTAPTRSVLPIVVPGQLTLRTIRGKNGPFTVGRLTTPIGEFAVKDAELEQYPKASTTGTLSFATSSQSPIRSRAVHG